MTDAGPPRGVGGALRAIRWSCRHARRLQMHADGRTDGRHGDQLPGSLGFPALGERSLHGMARWLVGVGEGGRRY